jgi:hypothetical protein
MAQISALFDADTKLYSSGPTTLPFKPAIYGHQAVKDSLQ